MINLRALDNAVPRRITPLSILEEAGSLLLTAARARRYKEAHREEHNERKRERQRRKYREDPAWRERYLARQRTLTAARRDAVPVEAHWDDDLKQEMALAELEGRDPEAAKEAWHRRENKEFYRTRQYPTTERGELRI